MKAAVQGPDVKFVNCHTPPQGSETRMPSPNRVLQMLLGLSLFVGAGSQAHAGGDLDCKLRFELRGWSAFYKTADGQGVVTCNNGARLPVKITSRGGGLTFGSSNIEDGRGEFSGIFKIEDVLGAYAAAEAHVGALKSRQVQVVTKGSVSLALVGRGSGWDIGVSLARFTLEPADGRRVPGDDEPEEDGRRKKTLKEAGSERRR